LFTQWQNQADQAKSRNSQWHELDVAMRYCKDLVIHASLEQQSQSIIQNRSLLVEPNPVEPLLQQAATALREAITAKLSEYEQEFNICQRDLAEDSNWSQLDHAKQQEFLAKRNLSKVPNIDLSSGAAVYDAIEATSFEQWSDRIAALPGRFELVRKDAVSLLTPQVVYYKVNKPTIQTEDDLQAWLKDTEQQLRTQLAKGPVTIA
ncbi:MAG: hypothetical protein QM500_17680, partial [Methylococcales bacterium]